MQSKGKSRAVAESSDNHTTVPGSEPNRRKIAPAMSQKDNMAPSQPVKNLLCSMEHTPSLSRRVIPCPIA